MRSRQIFSARSPLIDALTRTDTYTLDSKADYERDLGSQAIVLQNARDELDDVDSRFLVRAEFVRGEIKGSIFLNTNRESRKPLSRNSLETRGISVVARFHARAQGFTPCLCQSVSNRFLLQRWRDLPAKHGQQVCALSHVVL